MVTIESMKEKDMKWRKSSTWHFDVYNIEVFIDMLIQIFIN